MVARRASPVNIASRKSACDIRISLATCRRRRCRVRFIEKLFRQRGVIFGKGRSETYGIPLRARQIFSRANNTEKRPRRSRAVLHFDRGSFLSCLTKHCRTTAPHGDPNSGEAHKHHRPSRRLRHASADAGSPTCNQSRIAVVETKYDTRRVYASNRGTKLNRSRVIRE